jgi:NADH-quinone oxidoreductase subunit C
MVSILKDQLISQFASKEVALDEVNGQLILVVPVQQWVSVARELIEHPDFAFDMLLDLAGVDYAAYKNEGHTSGRFAVVYQLLSIQNNQRLRVRVFAERNDWPVLPSVTSLWSSANWFEREAYDLFGIMFNGHADLRRILTDYGFVGHPFRKDFPLSGYVEMRYDPEQKRVVYQPVTIEPRENTPRVVREPEYARTVGKG